MKKVNKRVAIIIGILILAFVSAIVIKLLLFSKLLVSNTACVDKVFQIPLTLQSGEKGKLFITDNRCELHQIEGYPELSFKVLDDGAVQDSILHEKLHIWLRKPDLSVEKQIQDILNNQFKKNNLCLIKAADYTSADDLTIYNTYIDPRAKSKSLTDDYCLAFGPPENTLIFEMYLAANNVLINERAGIYDGIPPFHEASIRFVKD